MTQNQAELNVSSTQQTFVHSLTGFQNGTPISMLVAMLLLIRRFAGTMEGAKSLHHCAKTAATCCGGAVDGANRRYPR